jgi:Ca-activated chloride channel family protein
MHRLERLSRRLCGRTGLARALVCALLPLTPVAPLQAGERCTEDAMIVFDGSGSMAEIGFNQIGTPRISEARAALRRALPPIASMRRLGLVIYGPGGDRTCRNIDLRFGPQWRAAPRIQAEVDALRPAGGTPLTEAVRRAAEALDYTRQPGTVVLVTDGKETCQGTPCQLAATLAADAPGLTVHVIGYKVRGDHFSWENPDYEDATSVARCLADYTGGHYVSAETVEQLIGALRVTLGCNVLGALGRGIPPG